MSKLWSKLLIKHERGIENVSEDTMLEMMDSEGTEEENALDKKEIFPWKGGNMPKEI